MADKITSSPAQTTKPLSDSPANVRNLIVVGFSTMHSSQTAVTWAATEAERRMAGLHIVHAYPLPQLGQPVQHDVDDLLRTEARTLLDRIADSTRRDHPQLEITTRLIQGAPVNALRDESAAAALTVVGAKESGRLTQAFLGSVASAVAAAHPAPVALVYPNHPTNRQGPVVVGIDEYGGSSAAIDFAFAEAAVRDTELVAVHAWNRSMFEVSLPDSSPLLDPTATEQEETAVLAAVLAGPRGKYPDVVVTPAVRRGEAATVLLDYSHSASVVVVGRRPRGEFEALIMGSTSRSVTAHSQCPVVIVHSPDTEHS